MDAWTHPVPSSAVPARCGVGVVVEHFGLVQPLSSATSNQGSLQKPPKSITLININAEISAVTEELCGPHLLAPGLGEFPAQKNLLNSKTPEILRMEDRPTTSQLGQILVPLKAFSVCHSG